MSIENSFSTRIPALDEALDPHLAPGNLILSTGLTGGGKTILAGQLAATMAMAGHQVLFISTQVPREELDVRILSAFCDIPYDAIKDRVETIPVNIDGDTFLLPSPFRYGGDATKKSATLRVALRDYFQFIEVPTFGFEPRDAIGQIIAGYVEKTGATPGVVFCDHLSLPATTREDYNIFKMREAAGDAVKAFAAVARDRNALVFIFCQADQSLSTAKMITSRNIFEFHSVRQYMDAFIGISRRQKSDEEIAESCEIWERIQHFAIETKERHEPVLIPVIRRFEYQRFDPYRGERLESERGFEELRSRALEIEARNENGGYVLARRKRLREIFTCGVSYVVNFYAFLLVAAKTKGGDAGTSFYSRAKLTEMLGLTSKQLRLAMDILLDRGLVDVPLKRRRRSLDYKVQYWAEDQNPATPGYFKLFHNLRDRSRRDLLSDPPLFRLWLYLLNEARVFPDEAGDLLPGEVRIRQEVVEEMLELGGGALFVNLGKLKARGSIQYTGGNPEKVAVTNWRLYQQVMYTSGRGGGGVEIGPEQAG